MIQGIVERVALVVREVEYGRLGRRQAARRVAQGHRQFVRRVHAQQLQVRASVAEAVEHGLRDRHLLVEGGAAVASTFLAADLVDRLLLYRAPILIGEGKSSIGYIGLTALADAHRRWALVDERRLGIDRLEVYERERS